MSRLVSILIPAFNAQEFIADTIRSALDQTWARKEIVIVDDGSTDRTLAIAQQFASKEVKVITQVNQGAAASRNKAFSVCQGDYIQWLDADDLLDRQKISEQMKVLVDDQNRKTLLSSAWAYFLCRTHRAQFVPTGLWNDLTPLEWLLRKWEENAHMQTGTWLVSRELTTAAGPWDTRLLADDDGEYFFRIVKASDSIRFVPGAKVFYRVSGTAGLSYIGRSNQKVSAQFLAMKLQIEYLRSIHDDLRVRAACVKYLQTWLSHFYPEWPEIVEQAQQLAAQLGGKLHVPELSWKYAWIQRCLSFTAAKRAQLFYNGCKSAVARSWDKTMYHVENAMRATPRRQEE